MITSMLIASIVLVVGYIGGYVIKNKTLPSSISAMVYDLEGGWRYLWQCWFGLVTIGVAPSLFEATKDSNFQFLAFLAIGCLMAVSAIPLVKKEKNKAHCVFAICGGVLTQICVAMICPWWLLIWLPMVLLVCCFYFGAFNVDNKFFSFIEGKGILLAELACTISLVGSLVSFLIK